MTKVNIKERNLIIKFLNNNEKFRPFKSKENIHKKEVGQYRAFGYKSLISDPINLKKGARGKYCIFEKFNMAVVSKTDISRKIPKLFQICLENESKRMIISEFSEYIP